MSRHSTSYEAFPAFTEHARRRMDQRGITLAQVHRVMELGRALHVRGVLLFVVGRREVVARKARGIDLRDVEGVHVLTTPHREVVLTAYRNRNLQVRNKPRRFYRGDHAPPVDQEHLAAWLEQRHVSPSY